MTPPELFINFFAAGFGFLSALFVAWSLMVLVGLFIDFIDRKKNTRD